MKPNLGEFELIARLASRLPEPTGRGVVGIGDDAAVIPAPNGVYLLTCDIAVEGRHFTREHHPMEDVGWRVATASVSDVVACGGLPAYALISLGVPQGTDPEMLDALYDGLAQAGAHYGFQVLGGNVSGAEELVVDCFMVGNAPRFIARSGARPGDLIALSGPVGDSNAGLALIREGRHEPAEEPLLRSHLRPRARTELASLLQEWATAAIDVSDSLASELHHLARAGGVGMRVEGSRLPVSPALQAYATRQGEPPLQRFLNGGEDYQILCTCPPSHGEAAREAGFTLIGEVTAHTGVMLDGAELTAKGWDHLR